MIVLRYWLLAFVICSSSVALADGGSSDPDFDYLPPEEVSMFETMTNFARSWFRSPGHAGSFTTAKRRLYNSLNDNETFYCGCEVDLKQRTFDRQRCNYVPA
jgi:hypothetical protein